MTRDYKIGSSITPEMDIHTSPTEQGGKCKIALSRKQIGIICGVIVILVVALVTVLVFALSRKQPEQEADNTQNIQSEQTVDYNQKITSEDGGEFKAEYQAGSEKSFAMRFSDLKCEDGCKNVSEVKLGDKTLNKGEDYDVKSGSIIVILTDNFMKSLKADKYDLVVMIVNEDKTSFYGVKFTVKPEPTCEEDETIEKGECIKKPEEQPSQNGQQGENTATKPNTQPSKPVQQPSQPNRPVQPQPTQPTTPSKPQAQIDCENKQSPVGVRQVHWYSQAEKQQNGYADDMVVGISGYSLSGAAMRWINGVCRPSNISSSISGGIGLNPMTLERLSALANDPVNQVALTNQGQDLLIWQWADSNGFYNGNITVEYVSDISVLWGY